MMQKPLHTRLPLLTLLVVACVCVLYVRGYVQILQPTTIHFVWPIRPQPVDPCPIGAGYDLAYFDADDVMFVAAPSGE